jgi:hypothetical protein
MGSDRSMLSSVLVCCFSKNWMSVCTEKFISKYIRIEVMNMSDQKWLAMASLKEKSAGISKFKLA